MGVSKKVALAILVVVLAGAIGVGAYLLIMGRAPFMPEVLWVKHEWGTITADLTEIRTTIAIRNPNPVSARLKGISYTIYLNGLKFATGSTAEEVEIPANGVAEVRLSTFINNSMIPPCWVSHIKHGEHTKAKVVGSATVEVLGVTFTLPFERRYEFRSNLTEIMSTDEPREVELLRIDAQRIYIIIKSIHTSWGEVTDTWTQAIHRVVVENPNDVPLTVKSVDYVLVATWEDYGPIHLARGSQPLDVIIGPGEEAELTLTTYLNNTALKDWWIGHITHNETTTLTIRVYATFDFETPFGHHTINVLVYEETIDIRTRLLERFAITP